MASIGSMARRWNEDLYVSPPRSLDDFFDQAGSGGLVVASELGAAIRQVTLLGQAVRTTSYLEPEPLADLVLDAAANKLEGPSPKSASEGLEEITAINTEAYERLKDLRMTDWQNEARAGSKSISVTNLARGISRVNAERLARAARCLASLT